jgi:hypothetical protein
MGLVLRLSAFSGYNNFARLHLSYPHRRTVSRETVVRLPLPPPEANH